MLQSHSVLPPFYFPPFIFFLDFSFVYSSSLFPIRGTTPNSSNRSQQQHEKRGTDVHHPPLTAPPYVRSFWHIWALFFFFYFYWLSPPCIYLYIIRVFVCVCVCPVSEEKKRKRGRLQREQYGFLIRCGYIVPSGSIYRC